MASAKSSSSVDDIEADPFHVLPANDRDNDNDEDEDDVSNNTGEPPTDGLQEESSQVATIYFTVGDTLETALVPKDSSSDDIKGMWSSFLGLG